MPDTLRRSEEDMLSGVQVRKNSGKNDEALAAEIEAQRGNIPSNDEIISMIPSKAVREYLTKIGHQFSERDRFLLRIYLSEIHNLYKLSLLRIRIFTEMDGAPRKQFGIARLTKAYNKIMKMLSGLTDTDE